MVIRFCYRVFYVMFQKCQKILVSWIAFSRGPWKLNESRCFSYEKMFIYFPKQNNYKSFNFSVTYSTSILKSVYIVNTVIFQPIVIEIKDRTFAELKADLIHSMLVVSFLCLILYVIVDCACFWKFSTTELIFLKNPLFPQKTLNMSYFYKRSGLLSISGIVLLIVATFQMLI